MMPPIHSPETLLPRLIHLLSILAGATPPKEDNADAPGPTTLDEDVAYSLCVTWMGEILDAGPQAFAQAWETLTRAQATQPPGIQDEFGKILQGIAKTAAESPRIKPTPKAWRYPKNTAQALLFAVPILFLPEPDAAPETLRIASDALLLEKNADIKAALQTSFAAAGLIPKGQMTILSCRLMDPAALSKAALPTVRQWPVGFFQEALQAQVAVSPEYGLPAAASDTVSLHPVEMRCLVGTLLMPRPENNFLEDDSQDNPDLHDAQERFIEGASALLTRVFPQWNVSVLPPSPFYEATSHALMSVVEYWVVSALEEIELLNPDVGISSLDITVALVKEGETHVLAQFCFCDPQGDILSGIEIPVTELVDLVGQDSFLESAEDMLEVISSTDEDDAPANITLFPDVTPRRTSNGGHPLFRLPDGSYAKKPVKAELRLN